MIYPLAQRALDPDRSESGQESYLGYLPEEELFISGWDTFHSSYYDYEAEEEDEGADSFEGNIAYIKIDEKGKPKVIKIEGGSGDMMYGKNGTLKALHKKHKNLIDIRLD